MSCLRVALSPKKVPSSNILGRSSSSTIDDGGSSPRKSARLSNPPSTPTRPRVVAPKTSPSKTTTYRVLTNVTIYETDVTASSAKVVLLPPPAHSSPSSPKKRKLSTPSPPPAAAHKTRRSTGTNCESVSPVCFLTPQLVHTRPVLEERVMKSASPVLRGPRYNNNKTRFTIYVDRNEYLSCVDTHYDVGKDVNKENTWPCV